MYVLINLIHCLFLINIFSKPLLYILEVPPPNENARLNASHILLLCYKHIMLVPKAASRTACIAACNCSTY